MNVRYLSDGSELRSYGGGSFSRKKESGGLFWWSILITLLMGLATFCWFFSIMVFQHPEKPFNYRLLSRMDKLPVLRKFSAYTAPRGATRTSSDLLSHYYTYTPEQLFVSNEILKRSYIRNYDKQEPPIYVTGEFQVVSIRPLGERDLMSKGWVIRTRAVDLEDVDVEILLPGLKSEAPPYVLGKKLKLDRKNTFAALVNVDRLGEDRVCASVVPLVYGGFEGSEGISLALDPPKVLNMEAKLPMTEDPGLGLVFEAPTAAVETAAIGR
ncbi:MAG: hypothetical protein KDK99_03025 [Verrucomicrobiales bacterium]|nr:hypothetical protein [Verrucomicrobiales bacterium]